MRYRAVVATGNEDAFSYAFSQADLDRVARDVVGKEVFLMFTEKVGNVTGLERGEGDVAILFEAVGNLIDEGRFYCVPSFLGGALHSFGLVPVPADSSLSPVEVVE